MNFAGQKAFPVKRFGGSADYDDPTLIPPGLATVCRNMRFRKTSVRTRDGSVHTMSYTPLTGDITGLDVLDVLIENPTQVVMAMTSAATLLRELPPGSGTMTPVSTPFILPSGASMQTAKAYNKIHMAMSDLKTALLPPMAIDGRTNLVAPVSQNPVGALWSSEKLYSIGDLIRSPDGRWWRCYTPSNVEGSPQGPQFPILNGQFIGTPLTGVNASSTVVTSSTLITPFGAGPWYVYVVNASKGTQFFGSFLCFTFSNGSGSTHFLGTFQVNIPADAGLSNWDIYIGTSPNLAAMTRKFTVVGTAAPQTFIASSVPSATAAPSAPSGYWSPSTVSESVSGSQWEEWTPNCTNQLPAPDVSNSATAITHSAGSGAIPASKDVYVRIAFAIGLGESPRSVPLVYQNTSANDQITVAFGNSGGVRIPRWIAEINLQPNFFNGVSLNVYAAIVNTGTAAPLDSAYLRVGSAISLGQSVVISASPVTSTSISPTSSTGAFTNQTLAYDGNLNTSSVGPAGGVGQPAVVTSTWTGFPAGTAAGQSLKVKSQASFSGNTGRVITVDYSLDGGGTWTTIYSVSVNRAVTVNVTPIPNGTDLTMIKVRSTASAFTPSFATSAIFEIWIDLNVAPSSSTISPAFIQSTSPNAPDVFVGEAGNRYMAVLRADSEASLSPVDPGSPIAVSFQGQSSSNVISISRNNAGLITATLADVSTFAVGQTINLQGCLSDTTLNGPGIIASVQTTLDPQGIVTWPSQNLNPTNDSTGTVILPAQPPPFAFLPTGGPFTEEYIAAFTVVGASKAGPFFYISEAVPDAGVSTPVVSFKGGVQVTQAVVSATRHPGGYVQCQVADITGFSPGQIITIDNTPAFPGMEGDFTLSAIEPTGSGTGGFLYWTSPNNGAAGPCNQGTVTVFAGQIGGVQAIVSSSDGLLAGQYVLLQNPGAPQFNGLAVIASVKGNVVTVAMVATGSANGGTLTVMQILPTVAAGQVPTIITITRDASGNVSAQVADVGGFTSGEMIFVAGVVDSSFDGLFQLTSFTVNDDGISGTLIWQQPGTPGSSTAGTITASPDPIINFDDNSLSSSVDNDVTAQLTAIPAPESVDVYYSPSLDMMVYTTGADSDHYFSDAGDPANIQNPGGILGVDRSNGQKTVCFREMINGELLSLKENGGYAITQGPVSANKWGVSKRWDRHGPCGSRAVAVGPDFLILFDENSGPHLYRDGVLRAVGQELQGTWDRLNKSAKEQVWIEIDDDRNEIYIGVPLDDATTPNFELTLNYFNGWNEPLMLTVSGDEMPDPHGRRWSENDRKARLGKLLPRDLQTPVDGRIDHRQMLYGMESDTSNNVYVDMTVPDRFNDNGVGIDSRYRPAFESSPTGELLKLFGMKGRAKGSGLMMLQPVTNDTDSDVKPRSVDLTNDDNDAVRFVKGFGDIVNELWAVEYNNGAVADAWFELQLAVLYGTVAASGRMG